GDYLHTNSVKVLGRARATAFPQFKAGQVLVSLREVNLLAVLDLDTRAVVWATGGGWRKQHDAEFLDNGHLLVYDNEGAGEEARVLEYDPATRAVPWSYAHEDSPSFTAPALGVK